LNRRTVALRALATLFLVALAVLVGCFFAPSANATNSKVYNDPQNDQTPASAADITTITISNDDASGLTIRIQFSNRSSLGSNEAIYVYMDADKNDSTGDSGSDYRIGAESGDPLHLCKIEKYNGSSFAAYASPSSATFDSSGLTCTFSRADLSNTTGFKFFVVTLDAGSIADLYGDASSKDTYDVIIGSPSPPPPPPPPPPAPPAPPSPLPPPPDADHDGVVDTHDLCPTVASGPYDRNANGCPGPYPRMTPSFHPIAATFGGFTTYTRFVISNLVPGSSVTVRFHGLVERLRAKRRSVASKLLLRKHVRRGTRITVRAAKRGAIGYDTTAVVTTVAPAFRIVRTRCIPATGGSTPRSCSRVNRGK
jgi:hypothetical protein